MSPLEVGENEYLLKLAMQKMTKMTQQAIKSLRNSRDKLEFVTLPTMEKAAKLPTARLIKIIFRCPLSRYFGVNLRALNAKFSSKAKAMIEVMAIIGIWR